MIRAIAARALISVALVVPAWYLHRGAALQCDSLVFAYNRLVSKQAQGVPIVELSDGVERLREIVQSQQKAIPETTGVAEILSDLQRHTDSLGLSDRTWGVSSVQPAGSYLRIPVTLTCYGSLEGVYHLIEMLGSYPRVTRVERLSLRFRPELGANRLQVSLQLSTYARASTRESGPEGMVKR